MIRSWEYLDRVFPMNDDDWLLQASFHKVFMDTLAGKHYYPSLHVMISLAWQDAFDTLFEELPRPCECRPETADAVRECYEEQLNLFMAGTGTFNDTNLGSKTLDILARMIEEDPQAVMRMEREHDAQK